MAAPAASAGPQPAAGSGKAIEVNWTDIIGQRSRVPFVTLEPYDWQPPDRQTNLRTMTADQIQGLTIDQLAGHNLYGGAGAPRTQMQFAATDQGLGRNGTAPPWYSDLPAVLHYALFPVVHKRNERVEVGQNHAHTLSIDVMAMAAIITSFQPRALVGNLITVDFRQIWPKGNQQGNHIWIESSLLADASVQLSVVAALADIEFPNGAYLTFLPYSPQFQRYAHANRWDQFMIRGASLGLAVAAAAGGGASVMYTGYLLDASDQRYSKKYGTSQTGYWYSPYKTTNIVETVDDMQWKILFALLHNIPFVYPWSDTNNLPMKQYTATEEFKRHHFALSAAQGAYTMQDKDQGMRLVDRRTPLMIAVTLTEARLLGLIAWIAYSVDSTVWAGGPTRVKTNNILPTVIDRAEQKYIKQKAKKKKGLKARRADKAAALKKKQEKLEEEYEQQLRNMQASAERRRATKQWREQNPLPPSIKTVAAEQLWTNVAGPNAGPAPFAPHVAHRKADQQERFEQARAIRAANVAASRGQSQAPMMDIDEDEGDEGEQQQDQGPGTPLGGNAVPSNIGHTVHQAKMSGKRKTAKAQRETGAATPSVRKTAAEKAEEEAEKKKKKEVPKQPPQNQ